MARENKRMRIKIVEMNQKCKNQNRQSEQI